MDVVVISKNDLKVLINECISSALAGFNKEDNKSIVQQRWLKMDEALEIINLKGIKIKKSYLYVLIHKGEVPYHKNGRAVVFDKRELEQWADDRPKSPRAVMEAESLSNINKSARSKKRLRSYPINI